MVLANRRSSTGDTEALRRGIRHRELVAHYQPKVDLASGRVVGVEALVRWNRPGHGLAYPDQFIHLAEDTGLVGEITTFMLEEAAGQHKTWHNLGFYLPVAVNLSPDSLGDTLPDFIVDVCDRHAINRRGIELEITESCIMTNPRAAKGILSSLADRGFSVALDDFGTGFSSLSHLRTMPVSEVKIDKSFVGNAVQSAADAHIVRGVIELAHGLGKKVIAEGVETAETAKLLLMMGSEMGQGYYWSPPRPPEDLTKALHGKLVPSESAAEIPTGTHQTLSEEKRLATLRSYSVIDTAYETIFDDIAAVASRICDAPMSAISLVDADRQWFKAQVGLDVRETTRNVAFCARTILDPSTTLVVNDALKDDRFSTNPLVTGEPGIRFYAGSPLVAPDGSAIGSLCVIDRKPRTLDPHQLAALEELSQHTMAVLEARKCLRGLSGSSFH